MPNRAARRRDAREREHRGEPRKEFRLQFSLSQPGGPLRSSFPSIHGETLEADTEADLVRGIVVKLLEAFGFVNQEKAVAGIFSEVINPIGQRLRGLIAYGILEGWGLSVRVEDATFCSVCGTEKTEVEPEPEHNEECQALVETAGEEGREWKTEPVIRLENPLKYIPLQKESAVDAVPVAEEGTADETAGVPEELHEAVPVDEAADEADAGSVEAAAPRSEERTHYDDDDCPGGHGPANSEDA